MDHETRYPSTSKPNISSVLVATWLFISLFEICLAILADGTYLHDHKLSYLDIVVIFFHNQTYLTITLCFAGFFLFLLATIIYCHRFFKNRLAHSLFQIWLCCFICIILFLYFISWGCFFGLGAFLNGDALDLWMRNKLQMLRYVLDMNPVLIASITAVTIILGITLTVWLPKKIKLINSIKQRHLLIVLYFALSCSMIIIIYHLKTLYSPKRQYLIYTISNHTGPFSTAIMELRDYIKDYISGTNRNSEDIQNIEKFGSQPADLVKGAKDLLENGHIKFVQHPIIPMEKFLLSFDQRKIERYNIILIIVESLRADQLLAYGCQRNVMPAVNKLSKDSMVFLNSYAQATHTEYSIPSILSSTYPLRSNKTYIYPAKPPYPRIMIYDILKPLGYKTYIFSSSHLSFGRLSGYLKTNSLDRLQDAETAPSEAWTRAFTKKDKFNASSDDSFTMGEVIKAIDNADSKPFFICIDLQSSHFPYKIPANFHHPFGPNELNIPLLVFGSIPKGKEDILRNAYADSLFYADSQIDRLLRHLMASGLWDKSIIIITGDHGQAFNEHGFAVHSGPLYNEQLKVPLVIKAPNLNAGIDQRPAQHIDIPPSILNLMRVPSHPSFQGVSLIEHNTRQDRSIFSVVQSARASQYAIVRSNFKLIYDTKLKGYILFDCLKDPGEKNNIFDNNIPLASELAARLSLWYNSQINYYSTKSLYTSEYPPIMEE